MHPHVDPLDQQLHDPRLLGGEQLVARATRAYRRMKGFATLASYAIQIDLTWQNALIASSPLSRPRPLRFIPPKGEVKLTARLC